MKKRLSYLFDDEIPPLSPKEQQLCEQVGCQDKATHRAPKNRQGDYLWFCLNHVRMYNEKWNYYYDILDKDIDDFIRDDVTWQRPTWPIYYKIPKYYTHFDKDEFLSYKKKFDKNKIKEKAEDTISKALALFDISVPFSMSELKKVHRSLVKKHHPDINADDKCHEMMRRINEAYSVLKSYYNQLIRK
jgi:hypothetical protein